MKKLLGGLLLAACLLAKQAGAATLFDNVYMVTSNGSTTPVTQFDINGPAPWLYMDLQGTTGFNDPWSWMTADWLFSGDPNPRFGLLTGFGTPDKTWFAPSEANWNARKAIGNWNIQTMIHGIDLLLIYGVGVGIEFHIPTENISFSIVAGPRAIPVPEPSSIALFALGTGVLLLGWALRRRSVTTAK